MNYFSSKDLQLILWAGAEELIKFIAVMLVLFKSNNTDQPMDWPIYFMTVALGFAALENTLFLLKLSPLVAPTASLITGNLRFLGANLLHTVSSGIIGIALGLSFFMNKFGKFIYVLFAIALAIALHSTFNFFIIKNNGSDFLKVFAFLWVVTIIIMLLFEKVRRMSEVE